MMHIDLDQRTTTWKPVPGWETRPPVCPNRLALAADHLRRVGLQAEERGHTNLANLCWRKRVEAMNALGHRVALDARAQHARFDRTDARSIW